MTTDQGNNPRRLPAGTVFQISQKTGVKHFIEHGFWPKIGYNYLFTFGLASFSMKFLVIIGNGLSDQPLAEKDNRTPLQIADTPNLDRLAQLGRTGSVRTLPESLPAGSDVSYLALLGYDPEKHCSGAGHFMARALGVTVGEGEMPLCCDFIILQSSHNDMVLKDYTAERLSREDSETLIAALQESIVSDTVRFHSGGGYGNLMVMKGPAFPERLTPPNELIGEGIRKHIPQEQPYRELVQVMNEAQIILHNHPFNRHRMTKSRDAINSVWFWGNGEARQLPAFEARFGRRGAVISASPLLRGMALAAGMTVPDVPGATGFADTDHRAKVEAALAALESHDVVYLHIAAGEPASLQGMVDDKIAAIEDLDEKVVGPMMQQAQLRGDVKLLVTENHMSSVDVMRYTREPVPFVVYPARDGADGRDRFDETLKDPADTHFKSGPELIEAFLNGTL